MNKQSADDKTEEKIKRAAKEVFHRKGFAATRTRDIAEAAGINLALLNYYFRSKEKLFQLIMIETLQRFAASLSGVFNDPDSVLIEKVEAIVSRYIDMLLIEPDVPMFLMSELRNHPDTLMSKLPIKELVTQSVFARQYENGVSSGTLPQLPIVQFIMNIMALTIFPFVSSPIIKRIGDLKDEDFKQYMIDRKKLIPIWINAIMNTQVK